MFPWNDVRLAPTFAWAHGLPPYPGEAHGPVSTWIYGPLPVLLWWPATWAASAAGAVLTAGAINLGMTVAAIGLVCAAWPGPPGRTPTRGDRLLAVVLSVALWPHAAFQYLQADNAAVALGLISNLILIKARGRTWRWGAAITATACLACKQTSIGVVAAQIIWLGVTGGWREALRHLGRCLIAGLTLALLAINTLDWAGLRFNVFLLPSLLPWTNEPGRRLIDLAPELLIQLAVPGCILFWSRRWIWRRESVLLLPSLTWLCALPPGLAGLMKIGGTINSLQSFTYWLPPVLVVGLSLARAGRRAAAVFAGSAIAAITICGARLVHARSIPFRPLIEHYRQADYLARTFRDEIWFPWHPLVTYYSEHHFYHVEDGLYVRFLAGHAVTRDRVRIDLPPRMCVIALLRGGTDWGIALSLLPPNARHDDFGLWTLYSWPPEPPSPAPPSPRG